MSEVGEIFINKAKTCAVSGHRNCQEMVNKQEVNKVFNKLISYGYDTFLIGMAIGFDTFCFLELLKIKKKKNIKIIACIPFDNQAEAFSKEQKNTYEMLLREADEKIYVSHKYSAYCMQKRNKFMVDNASSIVIFLRRDFGGTYNTFKYAEKTGINIINV